MEKKRPTILGANYLYLVVALLLITVGGFFQIRNIYSGIFITEYIIILLSMIFFVGLKKYDFKEVFKLKKISLIQVIKTIFIAICSYPIALFFNYIILIVVSFYGGLRETPLPIPENTSMFLLSLFLFALTPGICEEAMFRGVMYSAYERIGAKNAIVLTGILFGLFHLDIQNFLGPTFLGILFGFMVYKTGSIYTSVIAHTVNNSIAIVLLKIVGSQDIQAEALPTGLTQTLSLVIALVPLTVIASVAGVIVYFLFKSLSDETYETTLPKEKISFVHWIPILLVCLIFVISMISYFNS